MPASTHTQDCQFCGLKFPLDRTNCPQCARPQLFPNVTIAKSAGEEDKLRRAFDTKLKEADARGCRAQLDQFAIACRSASAVFRCDTLRLHRQIASGTDIFQTYHDLERLRLRTNASSGLNFEKLRPQAEEELLGNEKYVGQLHYACLSLDGQGISTYGDCVIQLSEPNVGHRASCFEGNTAVFFAEKPSFDDKLRSDWENKHKICTAAMGSEVDSTTKNVDHAGILVRPGCTPETDVFIEVQVFGDMTAGTFESVHFAATSPSTREKVYRDAICEKLNMFGVTVTTA